MAPKILTPIQDRTLQAFSSTSLAKQFYFTGGTALSHFYLQHRLSEDLDFFSQQEFSPQNITPILKKIQPQIKYQSIDFQTSFNRNIFHLRFNSRNFLKLEFTYFPFPQVKKPHQKQGLLVDSFLDIAVNKLFTISQKPRGRDYFDLYFIEQKKSFGLEKLRRLAKQKFDWHLDPLQLGSKLNQVDKYLDDPILTTKISTSKIKAFFKQASQKLKTDILSN